MMFEKVNRHHPDKIADRIAGAIVDLAYKKNHDPKVACEVLIGHGTCTIINETSEHLELAEVEEIVARIAGENVSVRYLEVPQDSHLAENQNGKVRCGDNGIFKGVYYSFEEYFLAEFAKQMDELFDSDGKYILSETDDGSYDMIICQSEPSALGYVLLAGEGFDTKDLSLTELINQVAAHIVDDIDPFHIGMKIHFYINPLGDWTGGTDVDTGATNRKLGSDMGRGVTGGGLHGKDLSKADVSLNIYAYMKSCMDNGMDAELSCSIGDEEVDGKPYSEIVEGARRYINSVGGFEKFAEYGLII